MAQYRIAPTEPAEVDLRGIHHYIAVDLANPIAADRLEDELNDAIIKLEDMPRRFPLVDIPKYRAMGYRKMVVSDDYIVLYTIDETQRVVFVERVTNARRDWVRLLLL